MNGSARQTPATPNTPRAPYAAPQAASLSPDTSAPASSSSMLAPFVPPRFRHWAPAAPAPAVGSAVVERAPWESPAPYIVEAAADEPATALPWIEAYGVDDIEGEHDEMSPVLLASQSDPVVEEVVEDSWLMGEAGKRLNELTQSLSSLDASRAAQAEKHAFDAKSNMDESSPATALPMWGDDDWMDIMPTFGSASSFSTPSKLTHATASEELPAEAEYLHVPTSLEEAAAEAIELQQHHSEIAANALESVARRIRAGDVAIPDFDTDMSEVVVLSGVLASLLRSGR